MIRLCGTPLTGQAHHQAHQGALERRVTGLRRCAPSLQLDRRRRQGAAERVAVGGLQRRGRSRDEPRRQRGQQQHAHLTPLHASAQRRAEHLADLGGRAAACGAHAVHAVHMQCMRCTCSACSAHAVHMSCMQCACNMRMHAHAHANVHGSRTHAPHRRANGSRSRTRGEQRRRGKP